MKQQIEALEAAFAYIETFPHQERCFTNDPNPDACRCVCGRAAILDQISEALPEPSELSSKEIGK